LKIAVSEYMCTTLADLQADAPMASSPKEAVFATLRVIFLWFSVYVAASLASTVALLLTGRGGDGIADMPVWVIAFSMTAMWSVYLVAMPRLLPFEERHPRYTFRSWFTARDVAIGVPLGIAGQLVLVNVVNWPLSRLFPDTFSFEEVSQRAEDISSTAPGFWMVLLVIVVVIGAPVIEEIVYRGSLQTALVSTAGKWGGIVITAALFAAIHLAPVEFPGLFAFALLLGIVRQRSGTLGAPIVTHLAFNATGLLLVSLL
jgi:membrane protease YdiL (CAAX protease family)